MLTVHKAAHLPDDYYLILAVPSRYGISEPGMFPQVFFIHCHDIVYHKLLPFLRSPGGEPPTLTLQQADACLLRDLSPNLEALSQRTRELRKVSCMHRSALAHSGVLHDSVEGHWDRSPACGIVQLYRFTASCLRVG